MVDVVRADLWIVGLLPTQRELIANAVRERLRLRIPAMTNLLTQGQKCTHV